MKLSISDERPPLQQLAEEWPELLGEVLGWSDATSLGRLAQSTQWLSRAVTATHGAWDRALQREGSLHGAGLGLPERFTARAKLRAALEALRKLRTEADQLRSELVDDAGAEKQAKETAMQALRLWSAGHVESYGKPGEWAKKAPRSKIGAGARGGQEGEASTRIIEKMLLREERSGVQLTPVLVLALDPALALATHRAAARGSPTPPDPQEGPKLQSRVLKAVQMLLSTCAARLPPEQRTSAQRVLTASPSAGLVSVRADLEALWTHPQLVAARTRLRQELSIQGRSRMENQLQLMGLEWLMSPTRWSELSAPGYSVTHEDLAVLPANPSGIRDFTYISRGMRVRTLDLTCLLLKCKRSKIIGRFDDADLMVVLLDIGQALPSRSFHDPAFGLFEHLKLAEALAGSRWFRKKQLMLFANTDGVAEALESAGLVGSDETKKLKFVRNRLTAVSRTHGQLGRKDIHICTPAIESSFVEIVAKKLSDLMLARNVEKGF